MEFLLEILVQILFEFGGGLIMAGISEAFSRFFRAVSNPRPPGDAVHIPRAILCQVGGVAAGLFSLIFARGHIIKTPEIRFVNLAVTPLLIALTLVAWGRFMEKHDRAKTPLNRFVCAYGFALCYMLARFAFAK